MTYKVLWVEKNIFITHLDNIQRTQYNDKVDVTLGTKEI